MDPVRAINILAILLMVIGFVFLILGLVPQVSTGWPRLFAAGVTMLVLGFVMLVVMLFLGAVVV